MKETEQSLRAELIRINRIVAERGLTRSSDGNISIRLNHNSLLITPSGVYKSSMSPDDLIVMDMDGKAIQSKAGLHPTSEKLMHLEVYRQRPDVHAIIHAHPPFSTALTIREDPFQWNISRKF